MQLHCLPFEHPWAVPLELSCVIGCCHAEPITAKISKAKVKVAHESSELLPNFIYSFNMIFLQILLQRYIIKHRVTIPCKRSFDFTWNLAGFQVKSTQNLINSDVSTKTIQFDECRREAMTLDFMKSGVIAPSMHPPQTEEFLLKHLIL